jgi:estrogen-related receptor beta like 1
MGDDDAGVENSGPAMGPIYLMCENSVAKLKILGYDNSYCKKLAKKPFSRVHFAIPGTNPAHQFNDFVGICSWLCTEITSKTDTFKIESNDDPNVIVNKLMLALRQLDFRSSFPPQKLRTPHGEPVCMVLDFLTDKALATRDFEFKSPIHQGADEMEQAAPEDDENDEIIDDEVAGAAEENEVFYEEASRLDSSQSLDTSQHNIIHAMIDPVEWKTELERVAPKLRLASTYSATEWRSHVDQTISTKATIEKLMERSSGDLHAMNKMISEELGQLRMKEKYVNNQHNSLCLEFNEVKKKLEEYEKSSSAAHEIVSKLTNELAEVGEKLDDLKESFESRDSGLNDTSPLVRIKAALQQIKEEIHAFDMRIGVVSHSLLAARMSDHMRIRVKAANKAKQRHRRGRERDGGGDSDHSADEE